MAKENIKEQLELIIRDSGFLTEKLERSDLNISDEKRINNAVKKARRILSDIGAVF